MSQYDLGQMFRCGELCEERRRRSRNSFAPSGSCQVLSQDCLTLYLETQNFGGVEFPYVSVTLSVFLSVHLCSISFVYLSLLYLDGIGWSLCILEHERSSSMLYVGMGWDGMDGYHRS